jgi:hypothetical protein
MIDMKKSYLILTMLSLFLAGCNSDSSGDQAVQPLNKLTIKGDKVERQLVVDQIENNIKISATNNDPVSNISWFVSDSATPKLATGFIPLNRDKQNFELFYLVDAPGTDNPQDIVFIEGVPCIILECKSFTRYQLLEGASQASLQLAFNGLQAHYVDPVTLSLPEKKRVPVTISGNLRFSIPNSWPVLKKQRFPVIATEGSLVFDGQTYHIVSIERIDRINTFENGFGLRVAGYSIVLKNGSQTIYLDFTAELYDILGFHIQRVNVNKNDENYMEKIINPPAILSGWEENDKELIFNFGHNLEGKQGSKILTSDLRIPKPILKATFNRAPLNTPSFYKLPTAQAENDRQFYVFSLGQTGEAGSLTLIQELKGHVSLKYSEGEQDYSCGNRELACAGLSMDADQKTWRFNSVKLGDKTLNGTAYIPGVFE